MAKKQPVVDHYAILSRRPAFETPVGIEAQSTGTNEGPVKTEAAADATANDPNIDIDNPVQKTKASK